MAPELAAWCSSRWRSGMAAMASWKAASCARENSWSASLERAKWVHRPVSRSPGQAAQLLRDGGGLLGPAADPRHAGVDLQVHIDGTPHGGGGVCQVACQGGVAAQRREPGRGDGARLLRQRQAEQQDRRVDAGLAQRHALVHGGHPEGACARLQGSAAQPARRRDRMRWP